MNTNDTAYLVYHIVATIAFSAAMFTVCYTFQNIYRDWKTARDREKYFKEIARKKFKNLKL